MCTCMCVCVHACKHACVHTKVPAEKLLDGFFWLRPTGEQTKPVSTTHLKVQVVLKGTHVHRLVWKQHEKYRSLFGCTTTMNKQPSNSHVEMQTRNHNLKNIYIHKTTPCTHVRDNVRQRECERLKECESEIM